MRRDTYLFERIYNIEGKFDEDIPKNWFELIGKELLEVLCKTYKETRYYLTEQEYKIKASFFNTQYTHILELYLNKNYIHENISTDSIDNRLFYPFYIPFIKLAKYYNRITYGTLIDKYFCLGLEDEIFQCLSNIATRTLIKELEFCKDKLEGGTEEEQYKFFITNYLSDENFINEIFDFYPLLLRCILDKICDILKFFNDFGTKWQNDKNILGKSLGISHPIIKRIKVMGDFHNGSAATVKIYMNEKDAIFYKPHGLANTKMYYDILNELYRKYGLHPFDYQLIDKDTYGWEREIAYIPCNTKEQLQRFYIRMGIQIMLNYLLDTQDLHYENLIAHGEYPIFVDVEIICGNIKKYDNNMTAKEKAEWIFSSSVLGNGILPSINENDNMFCSLIGQGGIKTNKKVQKIMNPMTSTMHLSYINAVTSEQYNRPSINGLFCKYNNFIKELLQGFTWAYHYIKNNSSIFKNKISFTYSRILFKNTQSYSKLLQLSYDPIFLTDGGDRQLILSKYYPNDSNDKKTIFELELRVLIKGDIPYFSIHNNERNLYLNNTALSVPDYLQIAPQSYLQMRINNLSNSDYNFQSWLIYNALNIEKKKLFPNTINRFNSNNLIYNVDKICEMIGDHLVNVAIVNDSSTDIVWTINRKKSGIYISDMYLYEGIAGMTIFFAALYRRLPKDTYQNIEKILIEKLKNYTISTLRSSKISMTGAFTGEASIVYAYLVLYKIKQNSIYLYYAELHEKVLYRLLRHDSKYDLLCGNAGAVIIYLNLYKITLKKQYLYHAQEAADYLILTAKVSKKGIYWSDGKRNSLEGLAHGGSGFSLCFAELYKQTQDYQYLKIALESIKYENYFYNRKSNNWTDWEHRKQKDIRAYWCHGAGGISLSRKALLYCTNEEFTEFIAQDYYKALRKLKEITNQQMKSLCLCHGLLGNMFILQYLYKVSNKKFVNETQNRLVLEQIIARSNFENLEYDNPGFMTGLSGIGYFLLHINDTALPNILSLEI